MALPVLDAVLSEMREHYPEDPVGRTMTVVISDDCRDMRLRSRSWIRTWCASGMRRRYPYSRPCAGLRPLPPRGATLAGG